MKYSAFSFIMGALPLLQVNATLVASVLEAPRSVLKMPDAQRVIPDFEPLAKRGLPTPEVTVDLSTDYWEGRVYYYNTTDSAGRIEEFTIHIVEGDSVEEEPTLPFPAPSVSPRDVHNLSKRQWYCDWIFGCADAVTYAAFVSANQIDAAAAAAGNYLRANDYEAVKRALHSNIGQFALGITGGLATWFITNKIQGQNVQATDKCVSKDYETIIAQIQADIKQCGKQIQAGDSRPKRWDHYSEERQKELDGMHLVHTTKPTKNSGDYKNINSC
ncbi:hypothetical protein DE146DRAFT_766012 [Phaeosphaeria sp. MPI-PUGE-AT-0046c]|nr:hypothetical protein DE146DRAFT_766012 [Phaeosphaeria sp. MPI-PUGE-AT-0046c]